MKKLYSTIITAILLIGMAVLITIGVSNSIKNQDLNDETVASAAEATIPEIDQVKYITKAELEGYRDEYFLKTDEVSKNVLNQLDRLIELSSYCPGEYIERKEYTWVKDQEVIWTSSYNTALADAPGYDTIFNIAQHRMFELFGRYSKLDYSDNKEIIIAQNSYDLSYRYGINVKSTMNFNGSKTTTETIVWINTDLNPDTLGCSKEYTDMESLTYDYNTIGKEAEDIFFQTTDIEGDLYLSPMVEDSTQIKPMQVIGYYDYPVTAYIVDYKVVETSFGINQQTGEERWLENIDIGVCRVLHSIDGSVISLYMKEFY